MIIPSFRTIVAQHLDGNLNLTPGLINGSPFLGFLCALPRHPDDTLIFVIDAFDECGNDKSRPGILRALTNAAAQVPWLKIIITSRTEADIQGFFDHPAQSSHLQYDLATDQDASANLHAFMQSKFNMVIKDWHIPAPWPEESDFNKVLSQAKGLFIFIKTLVLSLELFEDSKESLKEALQDSARTGLLCG